ncbi:hypothetical protein OC845_006906 [Tilletia horrida]|nr:hypothetical protein OC845_006906 [Tilletia horrida]
MAAITKSVVLNAIDKFCLRGAPVRFSRSPRSASAAVTYTTSSTGESANSWSLVLWNSATNQQETSLP